MSQFMLCQGNCQKAYLDSAAVIKSPFDDNFLENIRKYFWSDNCNVFTVIDKTTMHIDSYFTEAQQHLNQENADFKDTRLYNLLNCILEESTDVVLWYSSYIEDIPCAFSRDGFFRAVEEGVRESTCEVYIRYKKNSKTISGKNY